MFKELGFLSTEVENSENHLMKVYQDLFNFSDRQSKIFVQLLKDAELDRTSARNITMNALAAKSLELFQSAIILLRKGCIPAAKVLCRAQIETVYKLCAIELAENGIELYINQERSTRLQKLQSIQKYKQKYPKSGVAPGIESEIETLSKEKIKKTQPHEWASLAQMEDFHNLYYQGMSDDTHANLESLNHYFDENSVHLVNFGPTDKGLSIVAVACHRTLINAIEKYASFQGVSLDSDLESMRTENDELEKKYCA